MAKVRTDEPRALAERVGDAIRDPLFVADAAGRLLYANSAALEAFGYPVAELDRLSATDLLPRLPVGTGRPRGPSGNRLVLEGRRRDGTVFPAQVTLGHAVIDGTELSVAVTRDLSEELRVESELRRTTEQLAEAQRLARLGSWSWDIPQNKVTWSDELFRLYGLEPGAVEPSYEGFLERVHPADRASVDARNRKAFADHQPFDDVKRCIREDGSEFLMRTQGEVIADHEGNPLRMVGVCEDVTAEKEAERATAELASLVQSSADAIVSCTPAGTITSWNPGATAIYGWEPDEMVGQPMTAIIPDDLQSEYEEKVTQLVRGEVVEHFETRRRRRDGSLVDVSVALSAVRNPDGSLLAISAIARDITQHKRFEDELQQLADHDSLTGLLNRRRFVEALGAAVAKGAANGGGAVLMLDLDNFKYINDAFGHPAGDELLRSVASLLAESLGEGEVLARLGGDEFAVLLPGAGRDAPNRTAIRLLETLRGHALPIDGRPLGVTASIGIAPFGGDGRTGEELLADADRAMYLAKDGGRDRAMTVTATTGRDRRADTRLGWEHRIREALERDLFVLHCQPIMDLRSGEISQHELLLRMESDDELVAPGAFLGVAERLGLIHAIDRWVVDEALRLLAERPDLRLEVNLSALSLDDRQLLDVIRDGLVRGGVDAGQLIFEITETAAIGNTEVARRFAAALHELGCGFAIDDFGTGFGSFHYLKHLPAEYLKIDGDFVRHPRSRTDELVIESIVRIAQGLEKQTIGEFVEDAETLDALRRVGVDFAQGFYVGRPRPVSELLARRAA